MNSKPDSGATGWSDPDDAPDLDEAFFAEATYEAGGKPTPTPPRKVGRPKAESPKVHIGLRLDADVVAHFKAGGPGWQTRINDALRAASKPGV